MPTLYEQLVTARTVAFARMAAAEKEGTALMSSLIQALRVHMGCTAQELHVWMMNPEEANKAGGVLRSPGVGMTHDGLFSILVLEFGHNENVRMRLSVKPESGAFVVTAGDHVATLRTGDSPAISAWCGVIFKRFLDSATETYPMRI
jgi:hypothetical protein